MPLAEYAAELKNTIELKYATKLKKFARELKVWVEPFQRLAGIQGAAPLVALRRGRNPLPTEALGRGELKKVSGGHFFQEGRPAREVAPYEKPEQLFLKPLAA